MDTIGVICEPDHPVFGPAGERLAARGFEVRFVSPREPVAGADIDGLAALVGATLSRTSLAALRHAERVGVETWNGFLATTALGSRLVAFDALETVGCRVPAVESGESGTGTPRRRFRWDDPTSLIDAPGDAGDGAGWFRVTPAATSPVRDRYFAVDDGVETHVTVVRVRSELSGERFTLTAADVDVERATRVRALLDRFRARAVAVDFAETDEGTYAVDADPAPSFVGAEMERRVADSMASLATIGA